MKAEMPFHGIRKPERLPIIQDMKRDFRPGTIGEYTDGVRALWALPYREEKYAAIEFAQADKKFIVYDGISLYETTHP